MIHSETRLKLTEEVGTSLRPLLTASQPSLLGSRVLYSTSRLQRFRNNLLAPTLMLTFLCVSEAGEGY